jgi:hypothetical protein
MQVPVELGLIDEMDKQSIQRCCQKHWARGQWIVESCPGCIALNEIINSMLAVEVLLPHETAFFLAFPDREPGEVGH